MRSEELSWIVQMLVAPGLRDIAMASPWLQIPAFHVGNCANHRSIHRVRFPQWIIGVSWYYSMQGTVHWLQKVYIAFRVLAYMRFMPLPASIKTLPMSCPPICAFSTMGACPGWGTFLGWSVLLNPTVWSDHLRYSVVAGGDVMARFTCLDMLRYSFFDFGTGWIIAAMWPFDWIYPPLLWLPVFGCP
jgi:hypothetical protein